MKITAIRKRCEALFDQGFVQKKMNEFIERVKGMAHVLGRRVTEHTMDSDDVLRSAGMNSRNVAIYIRNKKDHPAGPRNAIVKIKLVYMDDSFGILMNMHVGFSASDADTTTDISDRIAKFAMSRSADEERCFWYTTDTNDNKSKLPLYRMNDVLTEEEFDARFADLLNIIRERMVSESTASRDVTVTTYLEDDSDTE